VTDLVGGSIAELPLVQPAKRAAASSEPIEIFFKLFTTS
jgi:hypothetical protein